LAREKNEDLNIICDFFRTESVSKICDKKFRQYFNEPGLKVTFGEWALNPLTYIIMRVIFFLRGIIFCVILLNPSHLSGTKESGIFTSGLIEA
jgi:hypothetical protein